MPSETNRAVVLVAVGATESSHSACRALVRALEPDGCTAYIVAATLPASRTLQLAELSARQAKLAVSLAEQGAKVEADAIYVAPPGALVSVEGDRIALRAPAAGIPSTLSPTAQIDTLLRSVALARGPRSVAVLLSDELSAAHAGLRTLRAEGGVAIALRDGPGDTEEPPSDELVECGLIDLCLSLDDIPVALRRYRMLLDAEAAARRPDASEAGPDDEGDGPPGGVHGDGLAHLARTLESTLGFDLTAYKTPTVLRRVLRRMSLSGHDDFDEYLAHFDADPEEPRRLMYDLLINVTDFFRDPDRFDALRELVVDPLVASLSDGDTVRVWVPGCATGEEAYSLGILILEAIETSGSALRVRIFATDIDDQALAKARAGVYPSAQLGTVPPARLERWFVEGDDGTYRVSPELRGVVSFALHDLTKDPPFARMHLVSCRNVLIYLSPKSQKDVLRMLHAALARDGHLFLSSSESVGPQAELFAAVSKTQRIFRKVGRSRMLDVSRWPTRTTSGSLAAVTGQTRASSGAHAPSPGDELRRALLAALAPPTVVVAEHGELLYSHGDLGAFLRIPQGERPRFDLASALRPELATRTRAAIFKCRRTGETVEVLSSFDGGAAPRVRITARSLSAPHEGAVALSFERLLGESLSADRARSEEADQDALIEELECELQATRDDLRTTVDELEASNEDLRASVEESMSMNEELQAANEELEATSEELRSVNEELTSVNLLLRDKFEELERTHDDLHNFFASTKVATVFLDEALRVKRFTPSATELLGLNESDEGRAVGDLSRDLLQHDLPGQAALVLEHLSPSTTEIRDASGRWVSRTVLPYRTSGRRIEGVVVTFSDVTALKQASERLALQEHRQGVLARIGLHALRDSDPQAFMDQVVREVQQSLGSDFCKILELQPGGERLLLRSGVGWRPGLVGSTCVSVGPDSQAGYTLSTGDTILVDDLQNERRFSGPALLVDHGVRSGTSAVIREGDLLYGVIGAHSRRPGAFDADDVAFLQAVASVVATGLSRHQARLRLSVELEMAHVLAEARDLDEALALVLDRVGRRLHAGIGEVWWPSEDGTSVSRGMLWVHPSLDRAEVERELSRTQFASGEGLMGRIYREDIAVWGTDVGDPSLVVRRDAARTLELRSGVGFPIAKGREVIGVVTVASAKRIFADDYFLTTLKALGRSLGAFASRIEAEARARRLAAITESAHDAILSYRLDGTVTEWLAGAEHLFGYRRDEMLGSSIERIVPDHLRDQLWGINERIQRGEVLEAYETTRHHKDGSTIEVSVRSSPVHDADGNVVGISSADRDITRQKEMERRLLETNRQKDEFLAMLGHELRNPLATISSASQLFELLDVSDDRVRRTRTILARQTEHMARLIDGLLDISRVASGKIDLKLEVFDLTEVCRQVVEDARQRASDGLPELILEMPVVPVWVNGDRVRLVQVVDNLVGNAVKYTTGEDTITVALRTDGVWADLFVRDTGVGIEPELLPHVFDTFRQSAQNLARSGGGMGLGLALVRTLTELHGGQVGAHSEGAGRGAEIHVRLPVTSEQPRRAPSGEGESVPRRVLLIEDNVDAAEMLEQVLLLSGHEVHVAHDGAKGLELACELCPDVVLCDIGLPGAMNGFDVATAMRAEERLAGSRLIAVSGYGRPEDKKASTDAGFDAHITKPIDVAVLERFLRE